MPSVKLSLIRVIHIKGKDFRRVARRTRWRIQRWSSIPASSTLRNAAARIVSAADPGVEMLAARSSRDH
jgi:hypothetical protein